jgi:arylsulfatase A-like enzyme
MARTHRTLLTLALAGLAGCGGGRSAPPNVLLVVVDTLRADHLGCYGYERDTSPHIDRLAAEGVRFEEAYSQAPWTTPSIGSLLTSRYASEIGIYDEKSVLSDDLVLLPEVLRDHGYRTGAVISHHFCSRQWNFDQGFESFDESNVLGHAAVTSESVTSKALEFVDASDGRPFFLWAHYFDPHFAYIGHDEHPFPGPAGYEGPIRDGLEYKQIYRMRNALTDVDMREMIRFYDSEIAHTDRWLGALFDGLRERGLWDDLLVVFTADHGEEFKDHGGLGHSRTVFQEAVHVPLLVKRPGGAHAGRVVTEPVPLLDVFPTILEHAGAPPSPGIRGQPLFDLARDERSIVSETRRKGGVRAVVRGRYKLIHRADAGQIQLFDLEADPSELTDLAQSSADVAERLRADLERWDRMIEARDATQIELSEEQRERLRKLGYVDAEDE